MDLEVPFSGLGLHSCQLVWEVGSDDVLTYLHNVYEQLLLMYDNSSVCGPAPPTLVNVQFAQEVFERRVGMIRSSAPRSPRPFKITFLVPSETVQAELSYYTYSPSDGIQEDCSALAGSRVVRPKPNAQGEMQAVFSVSINKTSYDAKTKRWRYLSLLGVHVTVSLLSPAAGPPPIHLSAPFIVATKPSNAILKFKAYAHPRLRKICPSTSPTRGCPLAILGSNFRPGLQLSFGTVIIPCTFISEGVLEVTAPPGPEGLLNLHLLDEQGVPLSEPYPFNYEVDVQLLRELCRNLETRLSVLATQFGQPGLGGASQAPWPVSLEQLGARVLQLQAGVGSDDLAQQDSAGRHLLHYALAVDMPELFDTILKLPASGALLNLPDHDGDTPLHYAAKLGRAAAAQRLVEAGADPSPRNRLGLLPSLEALMPPLVSPLFPFESLLSFEKLSLSVPEYYTLADLAFRVPLPELADALTAIKARLYAAVTRDELEQFAAIASPRRVVAPRLDDLVSRWIYECLLAQSLLLTQTQNLEEMGVVAQRLLDLAKILRENKNYDTFSAIITAFNTGATWNLKIIVDEIHQQPAFIEMHAFVTSWQLQDLAGRCWEAGDPHCLPWFGGLERSLAGLGDEQAPGPSELSAAVERFLFFRYEPPEASPGLEALLVQPLPFTEDDLLRRARAFQKQI